MNKAGTYGLSYSGRDSRGGWFEPTANAGNSISIDLLCLFLSSSNIILFFQVFAATIKDGIANA